MSLLLLVVDKRSVLPILRFRYWEQKIEWAVTGYIRESEWVHQYSWIFFSLLWILPSIQSLRCFTEKLHVELCKHFCVETSVEVPPTPYLFRPPTRLSFLQHLQHISTSPAMNCFKRETNKPKHKAKMCDANEHENKNHMSLLEGKKLNYWLWMLECSDVRGCSVIRMETGQKDSNSDGATTEEEKNI